MNRLHSRMILAKIHHAAARKAIITNVTPSGRTWSHRRMLDSIFAKVIDSTCFPMARTLLSKLCLLGHSIIAREILPKRLYCSFQLNVWPPGLPRCLLLGPLALYRVCRKLDYFSSYVTIKLNPALLVRIPPWGPCISASTIGFNFRGLWAQLALLTIDAQGLPAKGYDDSLESEQDSSWRGGDHSLVRVTPSLLIHEGGNIPYVHAGH